MDDWQPFLNAILVDPENDSPRLIACDWLDERGETARAEFIRVQVELAEREGNGERSAFATENLASCHCRMCVLRRRERELLVQINGLHHVHGFIVSQALNGDWVLFDMRGREVGRVEFRRGFVELVETTAEKWLQHGQQIVRAAPIRDGGLQLTDGNAEESDRDSGRWQVTSWRSWPWDPVPYQPTAYLAMKARNEAALLWASQEPCPECKGEGRRVHIGVPGKHPGKDFCADCGGRGSVDFRTLLGRRHGQKLQA